MIKEMIRTVLQSWLGRIGVALLGLSFIGSVFVLVTYPSDFGSQRWNNPVYWADHPDAVPPEWWSSFDETRFSHQVMVRSDAEETENGSGKVLEYTFQAKLSQNADPSFLSFSLSRIVFHEASPIVEVYLDDGEARVFLKRITVPGKGADEETPVVRYVDEPLRKLLTADFSTARRVEEFFSSLRAEGKDSFIAIIRVDVADTADTVGEARFVVGGNAFGLLGTDNIGRDLAEGILFGLPIALVLGISVAFIATLIGAIIGGVSGYLGGWKDTLMQRSVDVWTTLPVLPMLVFMTFVLGARLEYVAIVLIALLWTGLAIQLRPWVMQIRESGFITLARARGLGATRIILHILWQTFPLLFAYFVLMVPTVILLEAGLSFLGLGDPSIPTWGQILERAFQTGAVHLNYWWWVLPPGLAIVFASLAFPLIYSALESYLEPRLKKGIGGEI